MRNRIFLLVLFMCCLQVSLGQVELKIKTRQNVQTKRETASALNSNGRKNTGQQTIKKIETVKADHTVLYSSVVKRYGRWEGYGKPITKEYASHLDSYFKLTYSGGSKYPTRMQAYDGYHRLTTNHGLATYLVAPNDDTDKGADSLWQAKLGTVAQWDFVYNNKNEVFCERAYDANGDFVYAFYPVKVGKRMAGFFTDAWGKPAKLRKKGEAQVVYISYDKNGFECLREFYDENGYRQKNKDGAYMTRIQNSPDGLPIKNESCNIAGHPMIDDFGNCGMEAIYDAKGRLIYDYNIDTEGQPIRVKYGKDPFYFNMIKRKYDYDEYGHTIRMSFVNMDNLPDTNSVGIHAMEFTFNNRGKITSMCNKDLQGNEKVNPYSGFSRYINAYDDEGNILLQKNFGDTAKLSKKFYKELYYKYDRKGNEIGRIYVDFNGDSIIYKNYFLTSNGLMEVSKDDILPKKHMEVRKFQDSNQLLTLTYDDKGKQTLWEYSDLKGNPIAPYGYWKNVTEYQDFGDTLNITTDYYVDSLNHIVKLKDNIWGIKKDYNRYLKGKLISTDIMQYNVDSTFYHGWRNYFDADGNKFMEASLNKYHNISRHGNTNYYQCLVSYNTSGDHASSIVGRDEFGEPAYIEDRDGVSYFWNYQDDDLIYYDEYGNPIKDMEAFRDSLPAVMTIAVVDTIGYVNGLRDGDVILRLGDWNLGLKMQSYDAYNKFYFQLALLADTTKEITLLRHFPKEKRSEIMTVTLPKGTICDLGIFPQLVYYTDKELNRHVEAVSNYERIHNVSLSENAESNDTHIVVIRKPNRIRNFVPTYGKAVPITFNPSVVLSLAEYMKKDSLVIANEYWNWGMGLDTLELMLSDAKHNIPMYISMTDNLIGSYDGYPYYSAANDIGVVKVSDEQYNRIKKVYDAFIEQRKNLFNPIYRSKKENYVGEVENLSPKTFFERLKNTSNIFYTNQIWGYINGDSLRLPEAFKNLEMIQISKVQNPELFDRITRNVISIDTMGYFILPNFYKGDIALAKRIGNNLFDEIFIMYVSKKTIKVLYHKGCFSSDELLAIQNIYGRRDLYSIYNGLDHNSTVPLILAHTELDGLAMQNGIKGYYVILEYNNWNMTEGLNGLGDVVDDAKTKKKHLVLLETHLNDDGTFKNFGQPRTFNLDKGALGMRILDWNVYESLYERCLSTYEKYKKLNK